MEHEHDHEGMSMLDAAAAQQQADAEQAAADAEEAAEQEAAQQAHAAHMAAEAAAAAGEDPYAEHDQLVHDGQQAVQNTEAFVVAAAAAAAHARDLEHQANVVPQRASTSYTIKTSSRGSGHGQPKRRKINTCLPCKRRKVKCDKEKPHCGQCKKHSIPESDCTWSLDSDPGASAAAVAAASAAAAASTSVYGAAAAAAADWYTPAASNGTGTWSANGYVPAAPTKSDDVPRLLERIARLEQAISQTTGVAADDHPLLAYDRGQAGTSAAGAAAASAELPPVSGEDLLRLQKTLSRMREVGQSADGAAQAVAGEMERGMAADALAMIARHHPAGRGDQEDYYDSSAMDAPRFPFRARPSASLIREALAMLPQDSVIDVLFEVAKMANLHGTGSSMSFRLMYLQLASFRSEMARWESKGSIDVPTFDLSFLAALFCILGMGVELSEPSNLIFHQAVSREEEIGPLIDAYHYSAQSILAMCDFLNKPNLNVIMCLCSMRYYHMSHGLIAELAATCSLTHRLCCLLDMQKLGSAYDDQIKWQSTPPTPEDPRLPPWVVTPKLLTPCMSTTRPDPEAVCFSLPERSHLVREAARRAFLSTVLLCNFVSESSNRQGSVPAWSFSTKPVLNVDDDELPDGTEAENPYALPNERPKGVPTENSLSPFVLAISDIVAQSSEAATRGELTYERVLELDGQCRKMLEALPDYLKLNGEAENLPHVQAAVQQRPYLACQRLVLIESVHFRLLLLHRPYLLPAYRNDKYAYSLRSCVESARTVIFCRSEVDRIDWTIQKQPHFRLHSHNAAMILSMYLLEEARKGTPVDANILAIREEIACALNFVQGKTTSDGTLLRQDGAAAANATRRMIDHMLTEAANRAPTLDENGEEVAPAASASASLKRSASQMEAEERTDEDAIAAAAEGSEQEVPGEEAAAVQPQAPPTGIDVLAPDDPVNVFLEQLFGAQPVAPTPPTNFWETLDAFAASLS